MSAGKFIIAAAVLFASHTFAPTIYAQEAAQATVAKMENSALTMAEREIVSLAEAMPADKYNFAPTAGEFKDVRTFGRQMAHIAAVNYLMASAILGEKGPVDAKEEDGPASLKDKDAIVRFMKESFAYAHL
jgi:hypothetical protein